MKWLEKFNCFATGFSIDIVSNTDHTIIRHVADYVPYFVYMYDGESALPSTSSTNITGQYDYFTKVLLNKLLFGGPVIHRSDASTTSFNTLKYYAPTSSLVTYDYGTDIAESNNVMYKDPVTGYYIIATSGSTLLYNPDGTRISTQTNGIIRNADTATDPQSNSLNIIATERDGDNITSAILFHVSGRQNGTCYGQRRGFYTTTQRNEALSFLNNLSGYVPVAERDPYAGGGISTPGGGDGTFDFTSTDIPVPGLPSISSSDTGFISLYNPSSSQLNSMANYMWAGTFDIENLRKLFADPMSVILGCQIIPTISGHPASQSAELVIGNISTGLSMPKCTEQYFEVDCGTVQIEPKWGAYLDFAPYTKLSLYLPYIGVVHISPDDCMNGSINVKYHVDILSGSCCAFVYCTSNGGQNPHTLYTFNGSCNCPVPITNGQYANIISFVGRSLLGGIGAGVGIASGNIPALARGAENIASAFMSAVKPEISRSGEIGGSAGLMGIQYPYLILTIPKMCIPGDQNVYIGYPSFVTMTMSSLVGYTEIDVSHLNGMSCTDDEANEIIELLGSGVIF